MLPLTLLLKLLLPLTLLLKLLLPLIPLKLNNLAIKKTA